MDCADLVHGNLPLLVKGAYVPPLLFGHSRKMMNHDHVHPTNSAFSRRPLKRTRLNEARSTFPHTFCPACPLVFHHGVVCSLSLSTPFPCVLSHTVFLLLFHRPTVSPSTIPLVTDGVRLLQTKLSHR